MASPWFPTVRICIFAFALLFSLTSAAPSGRYDSLKERQSTSSDKMVFCHFMMGIVADRTSAADYDIDMKAAKAAGIDAFALNIGTDSFSNQQLDYAYQSAANNDMKVFISFDFNWFKTSDASDVGAMAKKYSTSPGQLVVDGKTFVSSFAGDGLDLDAVRSAAGIPLFLAPNFQPGSVGSADALLNWVAWPNNGNNKAPDATNNLTVSDGDKTYQSALGAKPYIAPVSAWFSTHYGLEVSYSKNWLFPTDLLWYQRWTDILTLGSQYLEILTWNDYGESHYVGPLSSPHDDDGASKWANDMPHDGWLSMATPYITAFKHGSQTVDPYITSDQIIYWYRPTPKGVNCDSTDTCNKPWPSSTPNPNYFEGKPNGAQDVQDSIFVVALLTEAGSVTITSGTNSQTFPAPKGATPFEVPMAVGSQSFSLTRNGQTVLSGKSLKDVVDSCVCGIYNFNAYVGTLPAGPADPLQPAGLSSFAAGLQATCQATPSLGTATGGTQPAPVNTGSPSSPAAPSSAAAASSAPPPPSVAPPSSTATVSAAAPLAPTSAAPTITPSVARPQPPISEGPVISSPPPTPAQPQGGRTVTALAQLAPTNCLMAGDVWAGPAGSDPAAKCDAGR